MKVLFLVPFMLPSFIGALAWKMLLSPRAGYINRFFIDVLGFDGPVFDIYTYAGIIAVETMYLFPFVFIQVAGALERMDPTLEESARISGADLFTITRKITIPLVLPSILSGALLIMLYSMAHFGTVAVLGIEAGIYNIPTLIYEKIHQSAGSFNSIRTGTVLATVLVITAAFILWLQNRVLSRGRYQIIAGKSFRPTEVKLRGLRTPMLVFCLAYIGFTIVLPTATIFMVGGLRTYGLPFTAENLTWENYRYILFEWDLTRDAIWNSISLGFTAAVITMFAGVIISYVIVKMKVRGKGLLEFLGMLPFSVPGSVIALGVILAWSGKFGDQPLQHRLDHPGRLHRPLHGVLAQGQLGGAGAGARLAGRGRPRVGRDDVAGAARRRAAAGAARDAGGVLPHLPAGAARAHRVGAALRADDANHRRRDLHAERGRRDRLLGGAGRHRAHHHHRRRERDQAPVQGRCRAQGLA